VRTDLPAGTVTFLFTDVEGSTALLHRLGQERFAEALAEHRRLIRAACASHDGVEVDTQGDGFFFAFADSAAAIFAAQELTTALAEGPIRVRAGLHVGQPLLTTEGYVGADVHLAARVAASAHGGQVVLTRATAGDAQIDAELTDLGEHRLAGFDGPVSVLQVGTEAFPPLRTISNTNLPRPASSFVGRERELEEVRAHLEAGARIVTLIGPGGSGKTRLAIEVATSLVPAFRGGVFWVGLSTLRDPALVTETIARTLGVKGDLRDYLRERELLLLIDNFEQVVDAAGDLASLLRDCPGLTAIVTSRELLRIQGEVDCPVPAMAEREAVSLFCARSRLEPTRDIAELCRRLDNLPLAVELAAARTKALSPAKILERLSERLDLLRGLRDADPRQQTLRTTIAWSYDLLTDEERRLFRRLSVFADGCVIEAAESVCDADLDALQSLLEKSLLGLSGERYWLLETIREFAAEQLDEGEAALVQRRLRAYVLELAEASAPDLHTAREGAVSEALAPEYGNIRAAVSHALAAGEPDEVGRLIGALYAFLISHGRLGEAREWTEAVLAQRDRLSERGLAEALVGGGEIARFAGDLDRAVELKEELAAVDAELQRPNWRAATLADLAEIELDRGDLVAARRYAERSAAAGMGGRAALCFGELALRAGDLDAAERRGSEALSHFEEGAFNHACALELLGETARRARDDDRALARFAAALRTFATIRDGGSMADCLDGFARLAAANGDEWRAGRLRGAAERLRETRGRRPIRTDLPPLVVPDGALAEGRAMTPDEAVDEALEPVAAPNLD
jgi:predicted ATPase/class 3 adenylate cyclase